MEDKKRQEKIQKQIQQKIAIANIRKEFRKQKMKQTKIVYGISSVCAVFVIGFGIFVAQPIFRKGQPKSNDIVELGQGVHKESLVMEWNINQIEGQKQETKRADNASNTYPLEKWPEKSQIRNIVLPKEYTLKDSYAFFTRNPETQEYTVLHDYIAFYEKDASHFIRIACSELGKPIRDYGTTTGETITKIGDQAFLIYQYQDQYFVTFRKNDIDWDIETAGITEDQLKEILLSFHTTQGELEEAKDVTKEPISITNETNFPEYYAGRYVDKNGNHVILLCQDTSENRKEICKILGITESKTKFQTATYSYSYLLELQNKISHKMMAKELPFVSTSAILEDKNQIRVTVHTKNETDLQKLKELDRKGGAIRIEQTEGAQTELVQEKE